MKALSEIADFIVLILFAGVVFWLGDHMVRSASEVAPATWLVGIQGFYPLWSAGLAMLFLHRLAQWRNTILTWLTPIVLLCSCVQLREAGGVAYWVMVLFWMVSMLMVDYHYKMGLWYKPPQEAKAA